MMRLSNSKCPGRRGLQRRPWVGPLLAALASLLVVLCAAPAYASYELVQTFGERSASGNATQVQESVGEPSGVAVNNTTGDVYVADTGNNRVMRFDSQGRFLE